MGFSIAAIVEPGSGPWRFESARLVGWDVRCGWNQEIGT